MGPSSFIHPGLITYATFSNGNTFPGCIVTTGSAFGTNSEAVFAASFKVCIESLAYRWLTRGVTLWMLFPGVLALSRAVVAASGILHNS
jgi:hypothetical protein